MTDMTNIQTFTYLFEIKSNGPKVAMNMQDNT